MHKLSTVLWPLRILRDRCGQDLIEYALLVGLAVVAIGTVVPDVAASIATVFARVNQVLTLHVHQESDGG